MTSAEFQAYELRQNKSLTSEANQESRRSSKYLEAELHDSIIQHCRSQWPRWKYIHARMDQASTIAIGCQDFTIFMPGRVLCVECKRVGQKLSLEQAAWALEMKKIGHTVHVVETFQEFLNLTLSLPPH